MAARKIKLKDQLGRVVRVPTATAAPTPTTPSVTQPETARPVATVWKLIREIPANIQKLAKLVGTGFTTRGVDGDWHQRSIAQGEGIAVTDGDGVAGNPTVALAELANAGGGTLQKTLRDDYGRLAGTGEATTDDLSEGAANLWYTDARADARALAAIAGHVAEPDPHAQYQMKLSPGTKGQFLRGDGAWSNEILGPVKANGNPLSPGMFPGLFGVYIAAPDSTPAFGMYDGFGQGTGLIFRRCNGTAASPTGLSGNALIGQFQAQGHDGTGYSSAETVAVWFEADGTWTSTSHPGRISFFTTPASAASPVRRLVIESGGAVRPDADNAQSLGTSSRRWSVIYAGTGTVNTSDAREKTPVRPLTATELAAAIELGGEIGAYQWLAMIEAKGVEARLHIGMTVQRAIEVMESHGLDAFRYGFICHDEWPELPEIRNEWPAQPQVVDDFGTVVREASEAGFEVVQEFRAAGDRYSFRMDELLAFIAKGMAHRLDAMEQRLAAAGL